MTSDNPTAALADPAVDSHALETLGKVAGFSQYLSPSYYLGEAMYLICDCNPFEWFSQQIAGDWHAVMAAGKAVANLGRFNTDFADAVSSPAGPLFKDGWTGKAATGADQYFDDLVKILQGQVEPLDKVSRGFADVGVAVLEAADVIKSLLESLVDYLIAIGVEAAAGAVVGWTVVGGIVVGVAIAAEVWEAYRIWQMIVEIWDKTWLGVQAALALMLGYLTPLRAVELQRLPNAAYDHPGV